MSLSQRSECKIHEPDYCKVLMLNINQFRRNISWKPYIVDVELWSKAWEQEGVKVCYLENE